MGYIQGSIKKYLNDLSARTPAPGGGSAAALSAAMAAGLVAMACQFTLGKEKYKGFQARCRRILRESLKTKDKLSRLADADVKAYKSRDLDQAIRVPAEVCVLSCRIMESGAEVLEKGNKILASDALLGVLLAGVSFSAGLMYVEVNLKYAKDKAKKYLKLYKNLINMLPKTQRIIKKVEVHFGDLA